jgi:hypothetical protein
MTNRFIVALGLTLFFATWGCGSNANAGSGSSDPPTPTVTFTEVYSSIISGSCTPCHAPGGAGSTTGRLDMSSEAAAYAGLQQSAAGVSCNTSGLKRVVPGDAAMSVLFEKVESANPPCGSQMPYGCAGTGTCLTAAQVMEIENWINEGAKND